MSNAEALAKYAAAGNTEKRSLNGANRKSGHNQARYLVNLVIEANRSVIDQCSPLEILQAAAILAATK